MRADGARSSVARAEIPKGTEIPYVIAYHEIIIPKVLLRVTTILERCDVIYNGKISPDFYGWVFPHGSKLVWGWGLELMD